MCQPVVPFNISHLSFDIENCEYRQEAVQADLFYDYEDGGTFNLDLRILDANS